MERGEFVGKLVGRWGRGGGYTSRTRHPIKKQKPKKEDNLKGAFLFCFIFSFLLWVFYFILGFMCTKKSRVFPPTVFPFVTHRPFGDV